MATDLHMTRIGHSCHLIEIAGQRLLTDPWFTVTPTYDPGECAPTWPSRTTTPSPAAGSATG